MTNSHSSNWLFLTTVLEKGARLFIFRSVSRIGNLNFVPKIQVLWCWHIQRVSHVDPLYVISVLVRRTVPFEVTAWPKTTGCVVRCQRHISPASCYKCHAANKNIHTPTSCKTVVYRRRAMVVQKSNEQVNPQCM